MDCSDDPQAVGGTINGMDPKVIGNPIVAWRDDTTLQIGWGAHALVVERAAPGLPAWIAMLNGGRSVESALAARRYDDALVRLASLRPAVDAFFDQVLVMDPDEAIRANRLALLASVSRLFLAVGDLSRLPG